MSTWLNTEFYVFLLRWLHTFAGLIWIGLLYYFNFVQGPFFAEADAPTKSVATQKLVPRALWWFRWAAFWTALIGIVILLLKGHQYAGNFYDAYWVKILTGSALGLIMACNVWFVIWPNQKVVIENAVNTAKGAAANPAAAAAGAKALLASRTNVLFSIPMLFFMFASGHWAVGITETSNVGLYTILAAVLMLGLEANALKGKLGPLTTVKGVITSGFILTFVFFLMVAVLI